MGLARAVRRLLTDDHGQEGGIIDLTNRHDPPVDEEA
jgi:hypothetical protein